MPDTYRAAMAFLNAGISVIPIAADGSKAPAWTDLPQVWSEESHKHKAVWKPYQIERPSPDQVSKWFFQRKAIRGFGIVGGVVSGNLEILDFDDYDAFAQLCADNLITDVLESMPLVETPSGGRHLYLRCEEPVAGNTKLAWSADKKTLIETRGEGGYVVAPGSPAKCHETGNLYRFLRGRPNTIPILTASEVRRIHLLCSWFDHVDESAHAARVKRDAQPQPEYQGNMMPGDWYNLHGDILPILLKHGWRPIGRNGGNLKLLRPGKGGKGLSATWHEAKRKFYVFSSNAAPFEPERAYSAYGVLGILEYGNNFTEAARAVRYAMTKGEFK